MRKVSFVLLALALLCGAALAACGGSDDETTGPAIEEIDLATLGDDVDVETVAAIRQNPAVFLLDVREPDEYAAGHIPSITLIPSGEVADRLAELPRDKEIIVTCRTGNRSAQVASMLRDQGFTNVHNMTGGIVAWQEAGYPVEQ
ncbi:MAG: rhodanese-like domain-containing protein [Candidatus Promineofilum sp.]|nr:rhodanese-like domain-containing protein [Promineifilum sp.]MCW5865085.1 rhodanese-like domain-containing protein [Anaerolineae bacterium]